MGSLREFQTAPQSCLSMIQDTSWSMLTKGVRGHFSCLQFYILPDLVSSSFLSSSTSQSSQHLWPLSYLIITFPHFLCMCTFCPSWWTEDVRAFALLGMWSCQKEVRDFGLGSEWAGALPFKLAFMNLAVPSIIASIFLLDSKKG